MTTHFITAEIDLQASPGETQKAVEAELEKRGQPLRWAITQVDQEQQSAAVEAIVTTPDLAATSDVVTTPNLADVMASENAESQV
jgi:hypothetical protein